MVTVLKKHVCTKRHVTGEKSHVLREYGFGGALGQGVCWHVLPVQESRQNFPAFHEVARVIELAVYVACSWRNTVIG